MRIGNKPARLRIPALVAAILAAAVAVPLLTGWSTAGYRARLVMPSAAGVFDGLQVRINNVPVGQVVEVGVEDGKAVVEVEIDDDHAPLHAGTKPVITYRSLVGEVYLQLEPGQADGPALPSGSTVETEWSQVSVEDVLETLDEPTREKVRSLLAHTSATLAGHEPDVNATVRELGPTVAALGQVLAAVGRDGPAISALVARLDEMLTAVASRRADLSGAVSDLAAVSEKVAAQQQQLSDGLSELPSTLQQAQATLNRVPDTVHRAQPLLEDLRPVAARLPGVAANLRPLVEDLQPVAADLRGVLSAADPLLGRTPGLLDSAHAVLPETTRALNGLAPALTFLRPYTPDLVGWLSNWAGVFGGYTSQGHYGHLLLTLSTSSVHNNPGLAPPNLRFDDTTAPGSAAGQPWTDASGDPVK